MKSIETANLILDALKERKAFDIVKIDVQDKTSVTDYFIIASARSSVQVKALAEHVEEKLEKSGITVVRRDGVTDARWIVLDYGDVMLHLFNDETRLFYHLERLWGEGEKVANED